MLDTIPGVGEANTAHLLVALSGHYGFNNAKQTAGLAPKLAESGTWVGQTRLSKTAATPCCARRCSCPPSPHGGTTPPSAPSRQRLKANGKNGKSVVCAAMRKLIHIAFGILKSS